MKCEFCDNDASIHLKQVLEEEALEMHLCEQCAEERGITDPEGFSLTNLLGGIEDKVKLPELKDVPSCAHCGFSYQDLKKVGRLGCSQCYKVFSAEVMGMLSSMHRGTMHKGKKPHGMFDAMEKQAAVDAAREKLELAITKEDFELAANLRDQIKQLKKQEVVNK